jgi:hypothetical protein
LFVVGSILELGGHISVVEFKTQFWPLTKFALAGQGGKPVDRDVEFIPHVFDVGDHEELGGHIGVVVFKTHPFKLDE